MSLADLTVTEARRKLQSGEISSLALIDACLERIFERYDAILTLSAAGQAPLGLEATGDPVFCTLWTFLGVPAVSLPVLEGAQGLPIGVQVIGPRGDDARLLRSARWLVEAIEKELR